MSKQQKSTKPVHTTAEFALSGRKRAKDAANSLQFLASIEGVEIDGHVRGANGMRWRLA